MYNALWAIVILMLSFVISYNKCKTVIQQMYAIILYPISKYRLLEVTYHGRLDSIKLRIVNKWNYARKI